MGGNAAPYNSSIVHSVQIDTIQVALSTVVEPPGSSYFLFCGAMRCGDVIILIFCREFAFIMISQKIPSSA